MLPQLLIERSDTHHFKPFSNSPLMKNISHFLLLSSFLLFSMTSCIQTKYSLEGFEKKAEKYVSKRNNRALAIGYLENGQFHTQNYGIKSKVEPSPPDQTTVFEIGAITQVFTNSLMMSMVEEGLFDPADCINQYLPQKYSLPDYLPYKCVDVVIAPSIPHNLRRLYQRVASSCSPDYESSQCISFCQLASHSAGLIDRPPKWHQWNPFGQNKNLSSFKDQLPQHLFLTMNQKKITNPPGKYYYSSTGMALLGNTLAEIKQQGFEELIRASILEPLRMKSTFFNASKPIVQGHDTEGNAVEVSNFKAYTPAAGLKSNVQDLLLFLAAQLDEQRSDRQLFWSTHELRVITVESKDKRPVGGAYGWMLSPLKKDASVDIFWCNGGTSGYRAFIAFEKKNKTAVVLLSNTSESVDQLGFYLLEAIQQEQNSSLAKAKPILSKH